MESMMTQCNGRCFDQMLMLAVRSRAVRWTTGSPPSPRAERARKQPGRSGDGSDLARAQHAILFIVRRDRAPEEQERENRSVSEQSTEEEGGCDQARDRERVRPGEKATRQDCHFGIRS